MQGFIKWVEKIGNKLPNPFMIFVWLIIITAILSFILNQMGVAVTYTPAGKAAQTVKVINLFNPKSLHEVLAKFVAIYKDFAPLGLVMVMMMGVGFIECTGWISAIMRKLILGAPRYLVTAILSFVGINANLASDAGTILAASVGGALFKAIGRNPMAGIIVGFVSASGGFTANLMVAGTDALLAGITESAMKGVGIQAPSNPLINWYFMVAATFILTLVTTIVTEKFIIKTFGDGDGEGQSEEELAKHQLTEDENKGLRWSGIAAILFVASLTFLSIGKGSFFANPDGTLLPRSPLISSIVPLLFFFFAFVGISYGIAAKTVQSSNDVVKHMQKSLSGSVSFMVVALPAALFIHLFNASGITTVLAVNGAKALEALNLNGIPLLLMFILLCTLVNIFMTSGSAKWLILAPIFVPMFAMGTTGFSPALTQVAYRIGDSATNIISPLNFYIPIVIGFMELYKKEGDPEIGMGSVISMTLPYSIAYLVSLSLLLAFWFIFNLPLGPGAGLFL